MAVISQMESPLGRCVGNSLEVRVEHSHWSRSFHVLRSDWWQKMMLKGQLALLYHKDTALGTLFAVSLWHKGRQL